MLKRAQKFNPFLLMGSLMVVVLLMVAACGGDAEPAPAMDEAALSNLQKSIDELAMAQPEGITADQVETIVSDAIASAETPEGISAAQVQSIVSDAISAMDTPEGLTAEQAQAILGSAIAAIDTPESLSAEDVQGIIAMVMGGQSEGLTAMQVQEIVDNALMAAQDPDALTAMKVQEIVGMALADAAKAEAEAAMMMEDKGTIVFADLNWGTAQIQSAIAKYITEHGYGYTVGGEFGATIPLFQGLLGGDIDVTMEIWLPNQNNVWLPALDDGEVIPVGNSLNEQWQSAFVIPTYLAEANPDLRSVEDIRTHMDLFDQEGGKVVMWTCPGSWACHAVNASQVAAYGLEDIVTLKPAEGGPLFASLFGAYEKEEGWLGYMWGPSLPANTLKLSRLEEPPCNAGQDFGDGCPYGVGPVRIAVHPTMVQRAPEVIEMLRLWSFTDAQIGEALSYRSQTDASFEETAYWFLTEKEDVWTEWVPRDVADRVKAALAAQMAAMSG
jgi:glycine betaine/proline transport system substrate-binding protein